MNLIESNDIKTAGKLNRFGGNFGGSLVAKLVMHIMRLNKINKLYSDVYTEDGSVFLEQLIDALGVSVEVSEEDLQKSLRRELLLLFLIILLVVWTALS